MRQGKRNNVIFYPPIIRYMEFKLIQAILSYSNSFGTNTNIGDIYLRRVNEWRLGKSAVWGVHFQILETLVFSKAQRTQQKSLLTNTL